MAEPDPGAVPLAIGTGEAETVGRRGVVLGTVTTGVEDKVVGTVTTEVVGLLLVEELLELELELELLLVTAPVRLNCPLWARIPPLVVLTKLIWKAVPVTLRALARIV